MPLLACEGLPDVEPVLTPYGSAPGGHVLLPVLGDGGHNCGYKRNIIISEYVACNRIVCTLTRPFLPLS